MTLQIPRSAIKFMNPDQIAQALADGELDEALGVPTGPETITEIETSEPKNASVEQGATGTLTETMAGNQGGTFTSEWARHATPGQLRDALARGQLDGLLRGD
jgi:hypothetical protein